MTVTIPTWRIEQLEAENDLLSTALQRMLAAFAPPTALTTDQMRAVRAAEDALRKTGRGGD